MNIFLRLPDEDLKSITLVCKIWKELAQYLHRSQYKSFHVRLIQVISPPEWAAKTGIENLNHDSFERCICTQVKKMLLSQLKELDRIYTNPDIAGSDLPPSLSRLPLVDFDDFKEVTQDIKDYNLGALCEGTDFIRFENPDPLHYIEVGRKTRKKLERKENDFLSILSKKNTQLYGLITNSKKVNLVGYNLSEIPIEFIEATKNYEIMEIDLEYNSLSYLEKNLKEFHETKVLNIGSNQFLLFPKPILELTHLTTLDLSCNPLKFIPLEIKLLKNLEILKISNTDITSLPIEILDMPNLRSIELTGTCIQVFSREIMESGKEFLINALLPHVFAEIILKILKMIN